MRWAVSSKVLMGGCNFLACSLVAACRQRREGRAVWGALVVQWTVAWAWRGLVWWTRDHFPDMRVNSSSRVGLRIIDRLALVFKMLLFLTPFPTCPYFHTPPSLNLKHAFYHYITISPP
ncbi:hypothetical protein PoB_006205100 [Plakobranchus ocellatus]|uniref:Secreted protein n=1 Tax=Plakobranchus ocellatus TaxID=259542 RepID=A0AAV4CUG0_9GAST|nr:hypothetical protein PoB_006205100 [Plakobranchus ocellatus]